MASMEVSSGTSIGPRLDEAKRVHNKMLYTTIATNYLHSTVDNGIPEQLFRANFRNYLDDPLSNSAKDVYEMIRILEQQGLVSLGDYDILVDIVKFDARIVQEIELSKIVMHKIGISIYRRIEVEPRKELVEEFLHRCKYTIFYVPCQCMQLVNYKEIMQSCNVNMHSLFSQLILQCNFSKKSCWDYGNHDWPKLQIEDISRKRYALP